MQELGLPISDEAIKQMKEHLVLDEAQMKVAAEEEKKRRRESENSDLFRWTAALHRQRRTYPSSDISGPTAWRRRAPASRVRVNMH